jgi:hypothetical protein
MIILASTLFLIIVILLAIIDFKPNIDRTSNGSIVIWYTNSSNGKRKYKYLWKQKEN